MDYAMRRAGPGLGRRESREVVSSGIWVSVSGCYSQTMRSGRKGRPMRWWSRSRRIGLRRGGAGARFRRGRKISPVTRQYRVTNTGCSLHRVEQERPVWEQALPSVG